MPNWVTNKIYFDFTNSVYTPEEVATFVHGKYEDGSEAVFDFKKIIPMPDDLNVEAGSLGETGFSAFRKFLAESKGKSARVKDTLEKRYVEKYGEDAWTLGKQYYMNEKRFGYTNWYDWCINNWGTKWNACHAYMEDPIPGDSLWVEFDTAWSAPLQVMEALSRRFPDVKITHKYSDEDIGSNVGVIELMNGIVVGMDIPDSCSKEAFELAFDIHDMEPDEWGLVYNDETGTYEWKE